MYLPSNPEQEGALDTVPQRTSRRGFLALGGVAAFLAACDSNSNNDADADVMLDFSNDFGVLNYAYALEQLEAAFYTQVIATPYSGISEGERQIMMDLKNHEVIHRDFLKAALGQRAIGSLEVNFSAINFSNRASVLATAKTFEDLGVAAYNGAGKYLTDPGFLTIAGKIVSVEARHASAIRDLIEPNTDAFARLSELVPFGANVAGGLDAALAPNAVLAAAAPFIRTSVAARNF